MSSATLSDATVFALWSLYGQAEAAQAQTPCTHCGHEHPDAKGKLQMTVQRNGALRIWLKGYCATTHKWWQVGAMTL